MNSKSSRVRNTFLRMNQRQAGANSTHQSSTRFTLSISANVARLVLTEHCLDGAYRLQLQHAISNAISKGVTLVEIDLSKIKYESEMTGSVVFCALMMLGRETKLDVSSGPDRAQKPLIMADAESALEVISSYG